MRLAQYKGERNLTDLAARLFAIQPTASAAQTQEVTEALLRANPHLADLSSVPAGAVIVVPDLPQIPAAGEVNSAAGAVGPLLDELHRRLDAARGLLQEAARQRKDEAEQTLQLLQAGELAALVRKDPSAKALLEGIRQATEADLKEADRLSTDQEQVFRQVEVDLQTLTHRLG
jgi:HAMP domain-containing protein